ncbi:FAD-dependent monooxygenase [Virgibacillus halodenitrificans]|uniref:FAD-dependent monooxygenase n=1 Tax=Virgibacillus halodenitrificans TaxID=1482 RepID=UPI001EED4A3D|nr:FAD-dependent monooxygenase [Virgibacillus halodenitrificans]MCG1028560.1 FAD-dependent monooxygenase [Virgibacillus halodenitrificans]
MKQTHTEVLIIGAGPTGLMLANMLHTYGIHFRIIDKKQGPSRYSKALGIHPRAMEIMELAGLSAPFLKHGFLAKHAQLYSNNKPLFRINFSLLNRDTDYSFLNIIPQRETELILENHLPPKKVERGKRLTNLIQEHNGVKALIQGQTEEEEVSARFVVGCDGAHSSTRKILQMPFEGKSEGVSVMLGDVKLKQSPFREYLNLISNKNGLLFVAPFKGEYTRIIVIDLTKQGRHFPSKVDMNTFRASISHVYGESLEIEDPYWLSGLTTSHRHAASYRDGNVLLAGDAAHVHNPVGGQGMNIGFQDAVNIAWKLAYVIKNNFHPTLLDSYQQERKPIAAEIIKKTSRMINVISMNQPWAIQTRNNMMKSILQRPSIQKKVMKNLSQLTHDYTGTAYSKHILKLTGRPAGVRVPPLRMVTATWENINVYELLRSGECLFLVYGNEHFFREKQRVLQKAMETFNKKCGNILRPVFLLNNESRDKLDGSENVFIDLYDEAKERLNLQLYDVLVIRPDAHTLFHTSIRNVEAVKKALNYYFK